MQKTLLGNSKGMSLLELMLATLVSLTTLLTVGTLYSYVLKQFTILSEKARVEENMIWAALHIRTALNQAVHLQPSFDPVTVNGVGNQVVERYDAITAQANCATPPCVPGGGNPSVPLGVTTIDTIAEFDREWGRDNSDFRSTGIYYRRPQRGGAAEALSGELIIDLGNTLVSGYVPNPAAANALRYNGISGLSVRTDLTVPPPGSGQPARAEVSTIVIVGRYFLEGERSFWHYCTGDEINSGVGGCPELAYRDLRIAVTVNYRNNELYPNGIVDNTEERLFGGLYFYRYFVPPINF